MTTEDDDIPLPTTDELQKAVILLADIARTLSVDRATSIEHRLREVYHLMGVPF